MLALTLPSDYSGPVAGNWEMAYSKNDDRPAERWGDLPYFIAVAREGSIKRAAAALGVTQSAVSKRIDSLEQWLGGRAFDRSARGTAITYQGERMLHHVLAAQKSIGPRAPGCSRSGNAGRGRLPDSRVGRNSKFLDGTVSPALLRPLSPHRAEDHPRP
ncbi:MAG: LysR family transcriptional regulator [Rhizomicrobium sp.]